MGACVKNLFILGRFDKDLFKDVGDLYLEGINNQSKDYLVRLITEKNKSEVPFIGNYDSLKSLGDVGGKYPDLTSTELYACLGKPEDAYKIREAISKREGPIPSPVKQILKAGNNLPIPNSFSSKYFLNSNSMFSEEKTDNTDNLSFNSIF